MGISNAFFVTKSFLDADLDVVKEYQSKYSILSCGFSLPICSFM